VEGLEAVSDEEDRTYGNDRHAGVSMGEHADGQPTSVAQPAMATQHMQSGDRWGNCSKSDLCHMAQYVAVSTSIHESAHVYVHMYTCTVITLRSRLLTERMGVQHATAAEGLRCCG
jgi:hypothetical protein